MNNKVKSKNPKTAETLPPCDVIMKGGITSGVIYPLAITELAKRYRLQNIGGTSAGAVAASLAAAAEYGRAGGDGGGGYRVLKEVPDELGTDLLSLFQPSPKMRPLFDILIASLEGKSVPGKVGKALGAVVRGYPVATGAGVLAGLAMPHLLGILGLRLGLGLNVLLPGIGGLGGASVQLAKTISGGLPDHGFGICTGLTQPGYGGKKAITDWLTDKIDIAAGRDAKGDPLTFRDLGEREINLQVMTTNLSMRRPYRLPLEENTYLFRLSEFKTLFPARVVEYMKKNGKKADHSKFKSDADDFYHFPRRRTGDSTVEADLPVVVAARMSLSFPGLISAVPLYVIDRSEEPYRPQLCWFSDGGLSSNFPIHLFDNLFPDSPTFGITLETHEKKAGVKESSIRDRVRMPTGAGRGQKLRIHEISNLPSFCVTLLDAAKDWQDNMQSVLPGYRERIVHVALNEDEGGLNLTMPPETIKNLTKLGAEAGRLACDEFDLDDHRWRRFLIAMANLEEALEDMSEAYYPKSEDDELSFKRFLETYPDPKTNQSYKPKSKKWLEQVRAKAEELASLGREWKDQPSVRDGRIPKPLTDLRLTPRG